MAETDIYKIKLGSDTYNLPFLPLSGGTIVGALDLTNSPDSSDGYKMGLNTAGNMGGGIHFKKNGNNDWGQAITWSYGDDKSQAGIYVKSSGGYGTKMYLCTTNLFADGSKAALEIDHTGKISALRSNFVGNLTGNCSGSSGSCTGNAATATYASRLGNSTAYHTKATIDDALALKHPLMLPFELSSNISYDASTKKLTNVSSQNSWSRGAYSKEGYYNGCYVSFKPSQTNMYAMIGLNSDPTTDHNFTSIDYCWYIQSGGALCVYENGTPRSVSKTSYEAGDELTVVYDGRNINYFCNGTCYRSISCTPGTKLYFDSSLYNAGSIYDVNYGPLTNTWPTNLDQLTNGPGYITGITKAMVTNALGYTPYNSTNPSGYITSSGSCASSTYASRLGNSTAYHTKATIDTAISAECQLAFEAALSYADEKLAGKSDTGHKHTKSEITDFPTSLPADGGTALYAGRLGNASGYYTKATLDTALAGKADSSHGTHVTTGAQTWAGVKTFSSAPVFSAGFTSSSNVTVTGKVSASSGFYEESDERLKSFKDPIKVDLEKLSKLRKSYFTFNSYPDNLQIGVSAQEIQSLYPELVAENENGNLTVAYDKLSVIALAAVDQLSTELNTLKDELQQIKAHLNLI